MFVLIHQHLKAKSLFLTVINNTAKFSIPLDSLIDKNKEIERLNKEAEKLQNEIARIEGKLSNENFVAKAPEKVVNEEKAKLEKYSSLLSEVMESLNIYK